LTPTGSPTIFIFAQIRDWYADLYLDTCKSTVFAWVNRKCRMVGIRSIKLNRIPFERSDGINTAVRNSVTWACSY
jgi:hypothetical protein